jgi:hypothetical protein
MNWFTKEDFLKAISNIPHQENIKVFDMDSMIGGEYVGRAFIKEKEVIIYKIVGSFPLFPIFVVIPVHKDILFLRGKRSVIIGRIMKKYIIRTFPHFSIEEVDMVKHFERQLKALEKAYKDLKMFEKKYKKLSKDLKVKKPAIVTSKVNYKEDLLHQLDLLNKLSQKKFLNKKIKKKR